jgi:2-phospho-L-lactate guanylyltransferase (CobY/MobA/RfbA family)
MSALNNKELQNKYSGLKDRLSDLKSDKVRKETLLESLEEQVKSLEDKIKLVAKTETVELAKKKLSKVNDKLEELLQEAEEIFNG